MLEAPKSGYVKFLTTLYTAIIDLSKVPRLGVLHSILQRGFVAWLVGCCMGWHGDDGRLFSIAWTSARYLLRILDRRECLALAIP
jgi:hypothetical protein